MRHYRPIPISDQAEIIKPEQWQHETKTKKGHPAIKTLFGNLAKIIPFKIPQVEQKEISLTYTETFTAMEITLSSLERVYKEGLLYQPSEVYSLVKEELIIRKKGGALC